MKTKFKPGDAVELFAVQQLLDDGKAYSEPIDEVWSSPERLYGSEFEAEGELESAKALDKHFGTYEPQRARIIKIRAEVVSIIEEKETDDES